MQNQNREIVMLFKTGELSEQALERELGHLEFILQCVESPEIFCKTHELVTRNHITQKASKITNVYYKTELKPFWFLIGKN